MSIPPPPLAPQFKSTRPPPKQVCDSSGPAFLADIKAGRSLRKVPDSEKKDRSAPFTSREANRNNESSVTGPTSVASGNIPLTGLPNLFANGVPKLKSVGSVDVTRGTVQNPTTKQPTCGYVKSPAPPPPPPQTSPPPSPPPTSSAVQNNFLSSTKVTTVPPAIYHRPSQTTNIVTVSKPYHSIGYVYNYLLIIVYLEVFGHSLGLYISVVWLTFGHNTDIIKPLTS
ncbi:hypothetical protein KSF78_0009154 [Schistosoma japonicum]|nr:hypothetical protein KSF78_0009154 [Schistosoma japonicum]